MNVAFCWEASFREGDAFPAMTKFSPPRGRRSNSINSFRTSGTGTAFRNFDRVLHTRPRSHGGERHFRVGLTRRPARLSLRSALGVVPFLELGELQEQHELLCGSRLRENPRRDGTFGLRRESRTWSQIGPQASFAQFPPRGASEKLFQW